MMKDPLNRQPMTDADLERLLSGARPSPERQDPDAARAVFMRALEESGVPRPRRSWLPVGPPRWALAAATCAFAFTLARVAWQPPSAPAPADEPAPLQASVPVRPAVRPPALKAAPVVREARPVSAPAVRRSPSRAPLRREYRPRTLLAAARPVQGPPAPPPSRWQPPTVDPPAETLASLLVVTAYNSPLDVKATTDAASPEGYARVAAYDVDDQGNAVVKECTVATDENGKLKTEFASAGGEGDAAYLKVEPAAPATP